MRLKLLDLFCGAGGAAMGYYRAGFNVVGVDIKLQKHYPFEFHQADALEYCAAHGAEFDAIHASPPCQAYSVMSVVNKDRVYPMLIKETRETLIGSDKIYVIENVTGARKHLRSTFFLCGASFDLKVYRHRWFETSILIPSIPHYPHRDNTPKSSRGKSDKGFISVCGNGGSYGLDVPYLQYASMAMGINWMSQSEISEAIPPAYTEFIGKYLIEAITCKNGC